MTPCRRRPQEQRAVRQAVRQRTGLACRMCGSPNLHPCGQVGGYAFVECSRCRFTFTNDVTQALADTLYPEGYHGVGDGAPEAGWTGNLDFLRPGLELAGQDRPLRILDFGTGNSVVPDILRGMGHSVVAVDVAPPLRPHPHRLTGCLLSLGLPPGQFDLCFSFQVFEHLPQPVPFVREMLRLARPGGHVLIHTDMETRERTGAPFADWWYVLPPDHCSFFRHSTFEVLLEDSPHEIAYTDPKTVVIRAAAENL